MAPPKIAIPPKETILSLADECESRAAIARRIGVKPSTFTNRLNIEGWAEEVDQRLANSRQVEVKPEEEEKAGRFDHDDGSATVISAVQTGDPLDAAELLRAHKIDPAEWRIVRQRANAWNAMTSDKKHGDNRVVTMHQLRVDLVPVRLLVHVPDPSDWSPPPKPKRARRRKHEPKRNVVIGDHHAPHHDKTFHSLFLRYLEDEQPHEIDVNGDLCDFATISRHREREGFAQPVNEGLRAGFGILRDYREVCPDALIRFKRGNHDERLLYAMIDNVRELHKVAPAEEELPALDLRRLLHLDALHVEYIDEEWDRAKTLASPRLSVRHGYTTSKNSTEQMLSKLASSTIQGHTHRISVRYRTEHSEDPDTPTETRMAAEAGCACEIRDGLGYVAGGEPDWQQGALLNYVWPDGDFLTQPIIYVPGRLLTPGGRRYDA